MQNLVRKGKNIRTQITLGKKLKKDIEKEARKMGVSLSEYIRRSAEMKLAKDRREREEIETVIDLVVGSVDLTKHKKVDRWIKDLREEWEE